MLNNYSSAQEASKLNHWNQGCVSLRFNGGLRGTDGGFHTPEKAKNVRKKMNKIFTSRWPGAKSAPVHQLAKNLYLRLWGHFKDRTPPP